jgi:hypothetical protein
MKDVGKPKAEVAAARIMERVAGVKVTPHFGRIEDKPNAFYEDFHVIVLGLDSVEASCLPARGSLPLISRLTRYGRRRAATSTPSRADSSVRHWSSAMP